jgi:hypothetical protein
VEVRRAVRTKAQGPLFAAETTGFEFKVTVVTPVPVQPLASVTLTVYTPPELAPAVNAEGFWNAAE